LNSGLRLNISAIYHDAQWCGSGDWARVDRNDMVVEGREEMELAAIKKVCALK
jgi:hypothetical protein